MGKERDEALRERMTGGMQLAKPGGRSKRVGEVRAELHERYPQGNFGPEQKDESAPPASADE